VFGSLWVVGGVVVVFLSPGEAPDWFLVGFGITGGLAGVLAGVRPLLGPAPPAWPARQPSPAP
jgi:hypothetical protein